MLQVIDRSGARIGEYEDVSQVEKYEMAESDYEKRPGDTSVPLRATSPPPQRIPCPPWWHSFHTRCVTVSPSHLPR